MNECDLRIKIPCIMKGRHGAFERHLSLGHLK